MKYICIGANRCDCGCRYSVPHKKDATFQMDVKCGMIATDPQFRTKEIPHNEKGVDREQN